MKIIGEKINGTRKSVARAIAEKNSEFIRSLARYQVACGADIIDVNAGSTPDRETEDLLWLVDVIQAEVDIPLCLDSSRPEPIKEALKVTRTAPMINSISGEPGRLSGILPLVAEYGCEVIGLALSEGGIPKTLESRLEIIHYMLDATRKAGIPDNRVYIDPLVMSIATDWDAGIKALDIIQRVKTEYPEIHITMGLSNISFGLPKRILINRTFFALALYAGLDSAIMDPTEQDMRETLLAANLVLGRDRFCREYTQSYRGGLIS